MTTLVAKEGKEFKTHRNVLSAASPFFVKLLQSDMKEKEEKVIYEIKQFLKKILDCSSPFWKQKYENLTKVRLTFFKLQFIQTQSIYD